MDRSFVMDADHSERALKILSAIIRMSHDLGMSVVAEGVETQEHWDLLVKLNVELFQGFLLSRPCPFEEFKLQLDPPAKEG
ncbi:MAG: EAL domain-containing protein [Oceanobacter sp.]